MADTFEIAAAVGVVVSRRTCVVLRIRSSSWEPARRDARAGNQTAITFLMRHIRPLFLGFGESRTGHCQISYRWRFGAARVVGFFAKSSTAAVPFKLMLWIAFGTRNVAFCRSLSQRTPIADSKIRTRSCDAQMVASARLKPSCCKMPLGSWCRWRRCSITRVDHWRGLS
jgi:hypothetical protein